MAEAKVIITAEDRTKAAFLSVQKSLQEMGRGVAGLLGVGALGGFLKGIVDMGDELAKSSQKLGISVESLSAYSYAAKLAGSSSEEMRRGLFKLANSLEEAVINKGSEAARMFTALGVSLKDSTGKVRPLDDVLNQLSDKFADAADGPAKTAIAIRLLGRSGAELIPFLNNLRESTAEARATGAVIGTEFAQKAEQFNDSIQAMNIGLRVFIANSGDSSYVMDGFLRVLKGVYSLGVAAADTIQNLGIAIGSLAAAAVQAAQLNFKEAGKIIELSSKDMEENTKRANEAINKIWEEGTKKTVITITKGNKDLQDALNNLGIPGDQFKKILADLSKSSAEAQLELVIDEKEKATRRIAIAMAEALSKAEWEKLSIEQRKEYIEEFTKFSNDKVAAEMKKSQGALLDLTDSWKNSTQQMQKATADWAKGSTDALVDFVKTGQLSFSKLADSIITDLIRIGIQKNITGPLFAGASSEGGLFSSIASMFGFAHGGSFNVGGSGGTDSQLVQFRATPGERVSVETPGQQAGGANVIVNVINQTSAPVQAENRGGWFDGEQYVVNVVLRNIDNYGPLRTAIAGV